MAKRERNMPVYSVFVAGPSDVDAERRRLKALVEEIDILLSDTHGIRVTLLDWRDHVDPGAGVDPQVPINQQIDDYDILVGILWGRLGTRTGRAPSGTAEEYQRARARFDATGHPRIMMYINNAPVPRPDAAGIEQLQALLAFQDEVQPTALVVPYEGMAEFERQVRLNVHRQVVLLHQAEQSAAASAQSPAQEEGVAQAEDREGGGALDMIDLRLALERKLAWLCNNVLGDDGAPAYETLGSLRQKGYLSVEQARLTTRIMALDETVLTAGNDLAARQFLGDARQVVSNFRATVFDGFVQRGLRPTYQVEPFAQEGSHRPDFLVTRAKRGGPTLRVTVRLVLRKDSETLDRAIARLGSGRDEPSGVAGRLIVIPDVSPVTTHVADNGVRVVRAGDLRATLRELSGQG